MDKIDFACLLMMAYNNTCRRIESDLRDMRTPWYGGAGSGLTPRMVRHLQTIPPDCMDLILAETGRRCIAEAAGATGPLGADSNGFLTTRYENLEKPYKKECDFFQMRQKTYWKYHITAILGLQIVLATFTTPGDVNDVTMPPVMLAEIRRRGYDFPASVL